MELFEVQEVSNGVYCITENFYQSWNKANMYLFVNGNESILVDTGIGLYDPVPQLIRQGIIKNKPNAATGIAQNWVIISDFSILIKGIQSQVIEKTTKIWRENQGQLL